MSLRSLSPNMFNTVDFLVKEMGQINDRNKIVNEDQKRIIEDYINTLYPGLLVKTADTISSRMMSVLDSDSVVADIFWVTGVSLDMNTLIEIDNFSEGAGIIKIPTGSAIKRYIILEDFLYSILAQPYSVLDKDLNLEKDLPEKEAKYIQKQCNCLITYHDFLLNEIGTLLGWDVNDKDTTYLQLKNINTFSVGKYEFSISIFDCMIVEMFRRVLAKIHRFELDDKEFNKKFMTSFTYTYCDSKIKNHEIALEYAKLINLIGMSIGDMSDMNIVYPSAWITIYKLAIEQCALFSLKILEENK